MLGFEYALYSLGSAIICSVMARRYNRDTNMWWLAGLVFGILPAFWLIMKSNRSLA